jgi:hypothetical protein
MKFELTVGQYSVFGWNHPGPSCFYALAVPYFFSGGKASSLFLGALILNALAAGCIVAVAVRAYRRGEPHIALWSMVFLNAFICLLGVDILASPWNPWLIVMPYAALLFLCAGLCLGWLGALPVVCLLASFVVQTHVAALPSVGATVAASIVLCAVSRSYRHGDIGEHRKHGGKGRFWVLISVLVLIACWFPPLLQEALHQPGNLTKLADFFQSSASGPSVSSVLDAAMGRASMVARGIIEAVLHPFALPLTHLEEMGISILQLVLLLYAGWISWRRNMHYAAALCLVIWVALLSGTWSLLHVRGRIWGYFTQWMAGIGVASLGVLVGVFFEWLSRKQRGTLWNERPFSAKLSYVLALGMAILMTATHIRPFITPGMLPPHDDFEAQTLADSLIDYTQKHNVGRILIELPHTSKWFTEIMLVNQLYKSGVPFALKPAGWPLLFNASFAPDGSEQLRLVVQEPGQTSCPCRFPVASQGSVSLCLSDVTDK